MRKIICATAVACFFSLAADTSIAQTATPKAQPKAPTLSGVASVYSYKSHARSASGEIINAASMVAAHRTLRFGTQVRVTNLENGRVVVVRITDRGPYTRDRVIDVSYAAAMALGLVERGVARVRLQVLAGPE